MSAPPPRGTLYVVGTPIGNLEDITLRALRILREADLIAAEDTRHTQKLLNHYGIATHQTSYHDHNKEEKAEVLIARMKEGASVALVSDAGTPGISDPGYHLICRAVEEGIPVSPIPGASASIAALSVSGLPTDAFVFEGFLPARTAARRKRLADLASERRTLIFFEAPHRAKAALQDLLEILGDRRIALGREMTKLHEEVRRGTVTTLLQRLEEIPARGEVTLVVEGSGEAAPVPESPTESLEELLVRLRNQGLGTREAATQAAEACGVSRKTAYQAALRAFKDR